MIRLAASSSTFGYIIDTVSLHLNERYCCYEIVYNTTLLIEFDPLLHSYLHEISKYNIWSVADLIVERLRCNVINRLQTRVFVTVNIEENP